VRGLKFLSVFLISIVLVLVPKISAQAITSDEYKEFYNCVNGDISIPDVSKFAGKEFWIEVEPTNIQNFGYKSNFRLTSAMFNIDGYGKGTKGISTTTKYWDGTYDFLSADAIFNCIGVWFPSNASGSFTMKFNNGASGVLKPLALENQRPYTEIAPTEPIPEPTPEPTPTVPDVKPPEINTGDGSTQSVIDGIISVLVDFFGQLMKNGLKIIGCAVALGVIFIGGKWLWRKTRQWLNNA
jgi:hypothetical protein